jgi:hypothetical protein
MSQNPFVLPITIVPPRRGPGFTVFAPAPDPNVPQPINSPGVGMSRVVPLPTGPNPNAAPWLKPPPPNYRW